MIEGEIEKVTVNKTVNGMLLCYIISKYCIYLYCYADDTKLYISASHDDPSPADLVEFLSFYS